MFYFQPFILSRSSLQSSQSSDIIDPDYADIEAVSETDSAERVITPPDIVISQQWENSWVKNISVWKSKVSLLEQHYSVPLSSETFDVKYSKPLQSETQK